jgi:aerobic carbon-monoxide dehydrogenase large subunit
VSVLGTRVQRREDPRFLTAGGTYVSDLPCDGAAWATFVRSSHAHARVRGIDVSDALRVPGVLDVVTAADLDVGQPAPPDNPAIPESGRRPFLATDVVRFVGEAVAVVLSETREAGADAVDLVVVDYDPMPAVIGVEAALADTVILHPAMGTNVCREIGDEPVDVSGCDVVVRRRIVNQRVAPAPLETQAVICRWTDSGRLEMWAGTQGPWPLKMTLAALYGIDADQVRVVSPDVGGGFGAKSYPCVETLLMPWLARHVARPVRYTETRSESMLAMGHGRGQVQDIVIGGRLDGTVLAYDLTVLQDCGAYPRLGALLPSLTRMMHPGTYRIARTACRAKSVVTNTSSLVAYRGAGRPEATAAIERAMDLFAAEIGMDPTEVRRRNLVPPDAFPYASSGGTAYDSGEYEKALDVLLEAAGYERLRKEQQERRASGSTLQLGIGVALYVEVTAVSGGREFGRVEIRPDGSAVVHTGTFSHGQGHATAWAMLVSDRTGVPLDSIEVRQGDTDEIASGGLTAGSRSAQIGGTTLWRAAGSVVERGRRLAAQLLEADLADVVLDTAGGRFHVAGSPSISRSWADVAALARDRGEELVADGDFELASTGSYPSGAHLAVVEVDTETGHARLLRLVAVDDAGRILNPLIAEGQVHGGLAQGAAQALLEEFVYDADGNPLTTTFADYGFVSAVELPSFETAHVETPSPYNELGVKGIGESGSVGSTPAVQNAVVDALSPFGVRHVPIPATPETVWRAINDTAGMKEGR